MFAEAPASAAPTERSIAMTQPSAKSIVALLGPDGFDDYCDTNDFAAFELQLETDLLVLENRWSALAAPHSSRASRRGSKFPKPFQLPVVEDASAGDSNDLPRKPR
jgi:hypothetical protein